MFISSDKINNLSDFVGYITRTKDNPRKVSVFRGNSSSEFELTPSLFRTNSHYRQEKSILRELISRHPREFIEDRTTFDNLVRMQHYNLPTRLLDITYNPLIALYFACQDQTRAGAFIKITTRRTRIKYYDSDTVTILANICHLNQRQKLRLKTLLDSKPSTEDFNQSDIVKDLLFYIRLEKPDFRAIIDPNDLRDMFVVKPKQNNRRIIAQQGGFIIFGFEQTIDDVLDLNLDIYAVLIPKMAKPRIISELDGFNINESTVFPELEKASTYIMSKIAPSELSEAPSDGS